MTIRSRVFPTDEEHGKRNDDLKPKLQPNSWLPKSSKAPLFRRRRIIALLLLALCAWLLLNILPGPLFGERRRHNAARARHDQREPIDNGEDLWRQAQQAQDDDVPESTTSTIERAADGDAQDFDGPIRFYYLASSLHAAAKLSGQRASNRNVLFAAADLRSGADLIPMACEMGRWKRNNVHIAVMGKDDVPLDEIKKVNAADDEATCPVFWHDARPDFARQSTNHRMEISVAGALGHIENFMHPQVIITNSPEHEDDFFVKAVPQKTKELDQTHIELPKGASESMTWMSRLDARALHHWHTATIDLLVQAPLDTSSNIVRLLKSLERADYGGFLPPRLTVELPHKLHTDTMTFLDDFEWPPSRYQSHLPYHQLSLHRRIPSRHMTDHEASTRFMESFYPYDTMDSHVLIMSPQAELSPTYFHYLKYYMLEYRYSGNADDLFGISLETPSSYLNGSGNFSPPPSRPRKSTSADENGAVPFLWQAPNTGAALIFADKWIELHSFLTQFFVAREHPKTKSFFEKSPKLVSERDPSWAEYLLDLMRARGYYFMYPGAFPQTSAGTSLAVIHNDMYQIPEEFLKHFSKQDAVPEKLPAGDVLEGSDTPYLASHHVSDQDTLGIERPLLRSLQGALAPMPKAAARLSNDDETLTESVLPLRSLSLLDFQGIEILPDELAHRSDDFALQYRRNAGGCTEAESKDAEVVHGNAEDLFCIVEASRMYSETKTEKVAGKDPAPAERELAPERSVTAPVDEEKSKKKQQEFKATGAAATVNAAMDPESYAATAVAGLEDKLKSNKHYEDDVPVINIDEHALTPEERRELNSIKRWRNKADVTKPKDESVDERARADVKKPSRSRADDEKDAANADRMEPVIDEREYERTDEYAPERPAPKETLVERPTEIGSRPEHSDDASSPAPTQGNENKAKQKQKVLDDTGTESTLPEEARDAAIGGKKGRIAQKGRIGGWDVGGYDEAIVDEKAAAAGRLDFARTRGRKSEDQIQKNADKG